MMYWQGNGMGGWGYVLMTLNMVLFWGLVVAGIIFLVRYAGGSKQSGGGRGGANADRILAERFARGEIDEEEYQRRLDTLRRGERAGTER